MKKNVIIILLIGLIGFLLISNRSVTSSVQNASPSPLILPSDSNVMPQVNSTKQLNLSNSGLEKLPQSALTNTSIEMLDISNNNLTGALPAEIRHLKNLKVLDAHNNNMTGVPAEIGQLENLEVLNLSNNQLTGLPYEMGNLKNLKVLDLSGNKYSKQDLDTIKQKLPSDVEIIL